MMIRRFLVKQFDPTAFLDKITKGKERTTYKPGDFIFQQRDPATDIMFLSNGLARETVVSDHGKAAIVRMIESGTFFGTSVLDDEKKRTTSVVAMSVCFVTSVNQQVMKSALQVYPGLAKLFTDYLVHHNNRLENEKIELLFNSVQVRLAKKLLTLAHVADGGQPRTIGSEITQEMLADMIGSGRPRVSFFLNRFRRLGMIEYGHKGVKVLPPLLKAVLEDSAVLHHED